MRRTPLILAAFAVTLGTPGPLLAAPPPDAAVSQQHLRATVEKLVSFGTRHTLSSPDDTVRGIGAARTWAAGEFRAIGAACGGCLDVQMPETIVPTGPRIPAPTRIVDVIAVQRGTERPNEVVIIEAHIDSRVTDVMNATADAPGANDDGSGSALVLEAARLMSRQRLPTTVVFALVSGEEQGLYGGKLLADTAKAQGWTVKAVFNNDIVGNTRGSDGLVDDTHVRVLSEGPRADADARLRKAQRAVGGENDSPSRNLSRFIAALSGTRGEDEPARAGALGVRQIWRADRVGRGGDHEPFQELGYPAVRFTVAVENFDHQHQDLRAENGVRYGDLIDFMDFPYLAKVTALNIAAAEAIARAPLPPVGKAEVAVQTFSTVTWTPSAGAAGYTVWRRRTDAREWAMPVRVDGAQTSLKLDGVRGDDWFFGVSARAADGSESPVASALPGGAFVPMPVEH